PDPDAEPPVTAELAAFLVEAEVDDRLRARAVDCLVDTAGAIVHGSTQPWSEAVIAHVDATGADGPCTVVGGRSTAPALAALANGSSAHAFELDDVHEEAISHPGAVVVPAAIAVGEQLDVSGPALLEAIVVGYEAMGRAGIAVGPAAHMLAGFHPTSMSGVFGAAAAAGRLLDFDAATLNNAFGIAVSLASGTMEFAASGGMAKRLHAGRAAEGGVTAALLAARGFEGATDGLAGRYGFCRVFGPEPRPERLTGELGERWMIDEITVKPWAACSDIHPLIQAAAELRADGLDVRRIARIEARAPTKAARQNSLDGTMSVMAAQYSAQWNVAAALVADPTDPATYHADRIADPAIAALQDVVVSVETDAAFDATYAWRMGGALRVELDDGSVLERTVHGQRGSMHDPLSGREVDAKFLALAGDRVAIDALTCLRGAAERRVRAIGRALVGGDRG
ncbi:MAG: MmgE/PrpD family protein, partial [Actinomycetota bacterium]